MKKISVLILVSIILAGGGFAARRIWNERTKAARLEVKTLKTLSAEEITLVLKSGAMANRPSIAAMKDDPEKRRVFLGGMREYLALAAEARREGLDEDENFRLNAEYKKRILLADLYAARLSRGKDRIYVVPEEELKAVWADPENEKLFRKDMEVLREIRGATAAATEDPTVEPSPLVGEMLTRARNNWARAKILSERARSDAGFINRPEIDLRLKIVEAGILAADLLRVHWDQEIKPTDAEMAEYLKAHPEFDVARKRQKAEEILQKVRTGGDFASLAKEFSEDRPTREKGGLYEDVGRDVLWKEVEEAALGLEKGGVADRVIETRAGFHIVRLEDKKIQKNPDGSESVKFSLRHILLQKKFEEPGGGISGIPPPFMTAEEIAKVEVEKEKRARFVNRMIERNPVSLPEDFTVELPEVKKNGEDGS